MEIDKSLQEFIQNLEKKGRSNSTVIAYKKDIEQLASYLKANNKSTKVEDLNAEDLELYVKHLISEGEYTLKTVSRKINSAKTFCKFLIQKGLIVNDPAQPLEHPEYKPQLPRVLSPLEYRALRDTARSNIRLYTMVELLLQTGIRIGELSRLTKKDVNLEKGVMYITEYSSNPARTVELNERAVDALVTFKNRFNYPNGNGDSHFFQTKTGNPVLIRNIRTSINRAFKKSGIKNATVNDIRNTFIVYQLENGIKMDRLAEIVGHQKSTTTEKYLELVAERPKKTSNKIEIL